MTDAQKIQEIKNLLEKWKKEFYGYSEADYCMRSAIYQIEQVLK